MTTLITFAGIFSEGLGFKYNQNILSNYCFPFVFNNILVTKKSFGNIFRKV